VGDCVMQNLVKLPFTQELSALSKHELSARKEHVMNQIVQSLPRQDRTLELTKLYKLYEDEWLRRLQTEVSDLRHLTKH
jgi:hypothetical protein